MGPRWEQCILLAMRDQEIVEHMRCSWEKNGWVFTEGPNTKDPALWSICRGLMHQNPKGISTHLIAQALDEGFARVDIWVHGDADLDREAGVLRSLWQALHCSRRARHFLGIAPSKMARELAALEREIKALEDPETADDGTLEAELAALQAEVEALEDKGTPTQDVGTGLKTHEEPMDPDKGMGLKTHEEPMDLDKGSPTYEAKEPAKQKGAPTLTASEGESPPSKVRPDNSKEYRTFIAAWKSTELIQGLPPACQWPATLSLWAEHRQKKELALKRFNEVLKKAGQPEKEGPLETPLGKLLVALGEELRVKNTAKPGCGKCRFNPAGCPQSCVERRREAAEKAALVAAGLGGPWCQPAEEPEGSS